MGGRSGQSIGSGSANVSPSLTEYKTEADKAIKEFGIKGTINIVESKLKSLGYASQNIANYDNGGNPFKNEIRINPNQKNIKETIRHELRHIMQGQKGQYYQKKENGERFHYWNDNKVISQKEFSKINNNLNRGDNFKKYQSFPWEKDARSVE